MPETNPHGQQVGAVVPGWTPRPAPQGVRLAGRYVTVEPLADAHAPALHAALCAPEDAPLWTYRPQDAPATVAAMRELVAAHVAAVDAAPPMLTWALVPAGRGAEGIASYMRIEAGHGQVEVAGVLYARTLQRTPAATEAIHLLLRYAFDELGYRRFEWKCDSLNEPSRRAAARLGFRYEGRFRNHMVTKGRNRDTDWFSITDTEWPAVRAAHERWHDPANFAPDGTQRTSLSALTVLD
ncbi:GNAT family N-acetyltransferase [Pimelobacter simplex]|uniref:GNAT family N-acetyltransferase n=1 Tax=Nocardioides simplex TaxID=2045 RepID=UPI003AAF88E8